MMRTSPASAVLALGVCLVAACTVSRPEITHLQLRGGSGERAASDNPAILVDAVVLPDYLLRDELLRRMGPYRLRYDPNLRWAEPLDLGIQRVLGRELGNALNTRRVTRFPTVPPGIPDWRLAVDITAFEAVRNRVILRGDGTWSSGSEPQQGKAFVTFEDTVTLEENASPDAVAAALSTLLHRFAEELADALRSAPRALSNPTSPPQEDS